MAEINMANGKNIVGNYRMISELAMGSFGRVYLAQHSVLTSRVVALKLMHTVPLSSDQECNQFLQEARFLELLHHDYILPILDVGIHLGMPYIVSEYASGGSLRTRLKHRDLQPLAEEELLRILSQIGEALQYAHLKNIIHRDLKPENILFNAKGDALLADFGLATMLATASIKYLSNAGTPRYMSPEQFQGIVSKESDQYALGCIAYELWTGYPLFNASDPVSLMYKHVYEAPVPLTKLNANVPSHVEQAILKALAKQRHDRHADVKEFITALRHPISIQQVPEPIAQQPTKDSNQALQSTTSIPDAATHDQEPEDEEQITTIKGASFNEERTRPHSTRLSTPLTTTPGYVSSLEEALPQDVYPLPTLLPTDLEVSSSQGVDIPPVPLNPDLGNKPSEETPALPSITPFPTLPISRPHYHVRRWLIVALVCLMVIASGIGGLLIMFSSFHSPSDKKGKTTPTSVQLEVQPNGLDFGTLQVGVKVIQTLLITNTGRQPLDWEVDTGGTTWLNVGIHSGKIEPGGPQQIIYTTANTDNLTPGTYFASEHIHSNASDTQIPVKLTVIPSNGKKQAQLSVNPSVLNFGNLAAGQQTTSLVTVGNNGTLGLNWKADTGNASWLSASPGIGTIQPGGFPQTLTAVANTTNLATGNYSATINIHSNGGNTQVAVMLSIGSVSPTQPPGPTPTPTQPPAPTPTPTQPSVSPTLSITPNNLNAYNDCSYTSGSGWSCNVTLSTNANATSNLSWQTAAGPGIVFSPPNGTLTPGQFATLNISFPSSITCPITYNLYIGQNTNNATAFWHCPSPTLTTNTPSLQASSCGHNSDGSWSCIVYIHSADTNEGMLHWTTSSSGINGITFRSPSGDMAPGDWNQSVVTIPATNCPASATFYFNPNGLPATVSWSC